MPWLHNYTYTHSKGRVKVTYRPCGVSSRWFDQIAENEKMVAWCNKHPNLKLKGEQRRNAEATETRSTLEQGSS